MASGKATYVPALKIITYPEQDSYFIDLLGDLDYSGCLLLDEAIKSALQDGLGLQAIFVNCKDLQFISSLGLGVFIENLHSLQAYNVALVLFEMNYVVRDIFSLMGLDLYFPIVASKEEAIKISTNYG